MTSPLGIWLQERTALGSLSPEVLEALAQVLEEKIVPENANLQHFSSRWSTIKRVLKIPR